MTMLQQIRDQVKLKEDSYLWWEGPYNEGPLLIVDSTMPHKVKQQSNSLHDFVLVNRLRHLTGPISIPRNSYPGCALSLLGWHR
jgi:hypothetical protein